MPAQQTVVWVSSDGSLWQHAFAAITESSVLSGVGLTTIPNVKKALKYLRKNTDTAVIIVSVSDENRADLEKLCTTIRGAMHNQSVRIIACAEDSQIAGSALVRELGVNAVLHPGQAQDDQLVAQVSAELQTFAMISSTKTRHHAETNLLTAIARFSRLDMKLSDCLAELARSTGLLTNGAMVNVIMVRRSGSLRRSSISYAPDGIDAQAWLKQDQTPTSPKLLQVVEEARLQLHIQLDDPDHQAASEALSCDISGRFIYPLRSFGRTMCLVECWLPSDSLKLVSVDLVRLIEKSSEQFGLLFERKQANTELKRQYKRLKFTLDELTSTKNALYHSEKLASLGQLAAGIAHEINNPIAYVMGNFNPLNDYVDSMTRMLDLHGKFVSMIDEAEIPIDPGLRQQIDTMGADLDLDYVLEDVRSLVADSKDGLHRVRDIIINLNEFARKDTVKTQPADLNKCIEATLNILQNELKFGVNVQLDLAPLPAVNCQPGLIKQVLLNLIKNGAQAMGGKGDMHITTQLDGEHAVVRVRDSGTGIPAHVAEKIFDPFFTTKPVGQGTGLGLSLCHGIVERHQGTLEVSDTSEHGTEFQLVLPIGGALLDAAA